MCSLLKLLILKFVKNVKVNVMMRQHNIWSVYVRKYWGTIWNMLYVTLLTAKIFGWFLDS